MITLLVYKSDKFWNIGKGLPLHTNSGNCIKISDTLCLAEDAGLKLTYYEASSLCSKRGMRLPDLSDFWEIWTSSENCHRAFSSNEDVPKNKPVFINIINNEYVYSPANTVPNYCKSPIIKFPAASQYKGGNFWLKVQAGEEKHYTVNYNTAKVTPADSNKKAYGARCVKGLNQK